MAGFSRNIILKLYDAFELNILRDYQSSLDIIQKQIRFHGNETIVDIGGGTGFILKNLNDHVQRSINIDPSVQMLLQQKNPLIHRIQADGTQIPLQDESADLILLLNSLHHIHKDKHTVLFKEIYRVLKVNGVFFLIDLYYPMTFLNKLFTMVEEFAVGKTYHISTVMIQQFFDEVGLKDSLTYYLDKNHWNFAIQGIKK